jgi:hypothetical protein
MSERRHFPNHGDLDVAQLTELSMPELVELYNKKTEKPIKVFNKKSVAVERVWALYPVVENTTPTETTSENEDDMAKKNAAKKASKKSNGGGNGKGRAPKFDLDAKIKVMVDENPKRKGTASYKRFEKYENGMKVADAIAKGVKTADIHWDVKHNYIALR